MRHSRYLKRLTAFSVLCFFFTAEHALAAKKKKKVRKPSCSAECIADKAADKAIEKAFKKAADEEKEEIAFRKQRWIRLSETENAVTYIDASSVSRVGDQATLLALFDFKVPQVSSSGQGYTSQTVQFQYECSQHSFRPSACLFFPHRQAQGRAVDRCEDENRSFFPVQEDTFSEHSYKVACAEPEGVPLKTTQPAPSNAQMPSPGYVLPSKMDDKQSCDKTPDKTSNSPTTPPETASTTTPSESTTAVTTPPTNKDEPSTTIPSPQAPTP